MKSIKTFFTLAPFILTTHVSGAVHLSSSKTGSAIIVPFYTVSNQMNTLLSLNNTTDENKAVKIHFKEAKSGDIVSSFNIYLTGQDMWTMATGKSNEGLLMISNDLSCTVGFPNNEDIALEEDWLWENGTIEIIEMGTVDYIDALQPYNHDCDALAEFWHEDQMWANNSEDQMSSATGGLHAEVTLMDVEQGHSANIPVIHLDGFYDEDNIQHTEAGQAEPNLASGTHDSMVIADGIVMQTTWPTGYEAVSALLMHNSLINEFNLESSVAAQTEWIVSFPTIHYHLSPNASDTKPFKLSSYGDDSKFMFPTHYWDVHYSDRNGQIKAHIPCGGCSPPPPEIKINSVLNLLTYHDSQNTTPITSPPRPTPNLVSEYSDNIYYLSASITRELANQNNFWSYFNGKIKLKIDPLFTDHNDKGINSNNGEQHKYMGLPMTGFSYTKFTNANAQPGLLAQYAFLRKHFGEKKVEVIDSEDGE